MQLRLKKNKNNQSIPPLPTPNTHTHAHTHKKTIKKILKKVSPLCFIMLIIIGNEYDYGEYRVAHDFEHRA